MVALRRLSRYIFPSSLERGGYVTEKSFQRLAAGSEKLITAVLQPESSDQKCFFIPVAKSTGDVSLRLAVAMRGRASSIWQGGTAGGRRFLSGLKNETDELCTQTEM